MSNIENIEATELATNYYTSYAKYILETRALPSIYDGMKYAQRRLMYVASKMPKDKFNKSSKVLGNTIPYHPHSLDSLYGSLAGITTTASHLNLFDGKGNWGGKLFPCAAYRYTECHLNQAGIKGYTQFLKYADYYQGESGLEEPKYLPALVPYSSIVGMSGIGVGLSTQVLPLNLIELIDYYIDTIKGNEPKTPTPDLGNFIIDLDDESIDYSVNDTKCSLPIKSNIIQESSNIFVVTDTYKNMEKIASNGKIGYWINEDLLDYRNESSESPRFVFEIVNDKLKANELKSELNHVLSFRKSFTRLLSDDGVAVYSTLKYQTQKSLEYLNKVLDNKFKKELEEAYFNIEVLKAIETLKDSGILSNIKDYSKKELIDYLTKEGYEEIVVSTAISKPITYLTKEHKSELGSLLAEVDRIKSIDRNDYLVKIYEEFKQAVLPKYESEYHSIRKSKVLTNPKVYLRSPRTLRVSSRKGIRYTNKILIISSSGEVESESIRVNQITNLDIGYDSSGISSDDYEYFVVISEFGGINTYKVDSYTNLDYKKDIVNLDAGDKIKEVISCNSDGLFEYEGNEYQAKDYLRKRYSKLHWNWKK